MKQLVSTNALCKRYGGLTAVDQVDLEAFEGEVLSVIGPNGAGKSTLFNLISRVVAPTSGRIVFQGRSLEGVAPYDAVRLGIARTFQKLRLFRNLSVLENVLVGFHTKHPPGFLDPFRREYRAREGEFGAGALKLIEFVGLNLDAPQKIPARNLPYGQQRLLEIARALAAEPRLLLLDEPAAGLNPEEKARLLSLIRRIREQGVTLMLVEHNVQLIMDISDRVMVLNFGRKICEGKPHEVRNDPEVIRAYLGTEVD